MTNLNWGWIALTLKLSLFHIQSEIISTNLLYFFSLTPVRQGKYLNRLGIYIRHTFGEVRYFSKSVLLCCCFEEMFQEFTISSQKILFIFNITIIAAIVFSQRIKLLNKKQSTACTTRTSYHKKNGSSSTTTYRAYDFGFLCLCWFRPQYAHSSMQSLTIEGTKADFQMSILRNWESMQIKWVLWTKKSFTMKKHGA